MINFLPVPLLIVNNHLDITGASRPAYTVFNARYMADEEAENLDRISKIFFESKELVSLVGAATIRLRKPGSSERFRWQNRERCFEVVVSALPDDADGELYAVVFDEKTDQIEMQLSSARVRSYLESIMSSLHLGIIVTDRKLSVTNMNREQEELLKNMDIGVSSLQAVGMPLPEMFEDETEILKQVAPEVLNSGSVYAGIVEKYGTPPNEKTFSVSFSPLRDENGEITGLIRVSEDITEKQRLETNLHKAELKAKEAEAIRKVVITLKHEINNSLMTIIGNVEVLLRTATEISPEKRIYLENILEWAERISTVTKRLEYTDELKTTEYLKDGPEMIHL